MAELLRRLGSLESARSIGWRGEAWTFTGRLLLEWDDGDVYLLNFATRPSLNGRRVVDLNRAARFGWWHYAYYEGDRLFLWLQQFGSLS